MPLLLCRLQVKQPWRRGSSQGRKGLEEVTGYLLEAGLQFEFKTDSIRALRRRGKPPHPSKESNSLLL